MRIADSPRIVDHLVKIRGVDPDGRLNTSERAIVLLVRRTLEEQAAEENGYRLKNDGSIRFNSSILVALEMVNQRVRNTSFRLPRSIRQERFR